MDWDYLRFIRALAQGGTLAKAGQLLGVHQTTVLRRLDQVEESMGVQFFERSRDGFQLTPVGETAFREAEKLAVAMENLERKLVGQGDDPVGKVRVAAEDVLLNELLSPILAELVRDYPGIELEVLTDNDVANLSHREADITVRPENDPQETLSGERIAAIESAVYGSIGYCRRHRDIEMLSRPEDFRWLIPDESFTQLATGRWYRRNLKQAELLVRCNSLQSMVALARAGAGLAVLPCYLGEGARELRRLSDPLEGESVDLWLHVNQDTQQMARVRIVMEYLVERLRAHAGAIEISAAF
ncbi:LysR family transcriptional regulator [Marinobacter salinisoli]|uniref:LysR family transcriptional regulator n=1 Tax=Marinobacter salinisoli TaxID=2769486 RepID=A0ABX7MQX7_9GAMM|nr:LysR family transcriptional regulator [Marinobacter salinisoli]QSP94708.1 LysR family transcriptional regulator [Marinobacter salinisoli]